MKRDPLCRRLQNTDRIGPAGHQCVGSRGGGLRAGLDPDIAGRRGDFRRSRIAHNGRSRARLTSSIVSTMPPPGTADLVAAANKLDFLADVAERARIPTGDADDLIRDFMGALSGVVERDAWDLVRRLVPEQIQISWDEATAQGTTRVEHFLLELSKREPVEESRAADHARAVGVTIGEQATDQELEKLASLIRDDDVLALFEQDRGGLTLPDTPTQGKKALQSPPSPENTKHDDQTSEHP